MNIDEKHIISIQEAIKLRSSCYLGCDNLDTTFQTTILDCPDQVLHVQNTIRPEYINEFMKAKKFNLLVNMIRLNSNIVDTDGVAILFRLQESELVEETRKSQRFAFSSEERVVCELVNPYDQETVLSKSVMDMSANGISLRSTFDSQLFQPGTHLPEVRVLIDGDMYTENSGLVVYKRKLIDLDGQLRMQVGIKFKNPIHQEA
jgi:hypothetical protein